MSYAVMPMADYKAVCDKVREKTNTTEVIKSGEMAEKVEEVYKAGQLSVFSSSEALKGNAEGNPVTITDISPVEHNVGVNVKNAPPDIQGGKNLEQTDFGYYKSLPFVLEKGKTYTVEIRNQYYDSWGGYGFIEKPSWANDSSPIYTLEGAINVFTPTETAEYCVFLDWNISPAANSQIFVSEEGQGGAEGVKVTVCGKNLFDVSKVKNSQYLTNNGDGTLTVSGAYGVGTGRTLAELCPSLKVGDKVSLRMKTEGNPTLYLNISKFTWQSGSSHIITEDDLNSIVSVYGKLDKGTYTISNIMVHYYTGSVLPFEPYVGHTEYTTNADGTVKGVKSIYPSMSISAEGSVTISAEYYKDIDKVLENLAINTALSGGE